MRSLLKTLVICFLFAHCYASANAQKITSIRQCDDFMNADKPVLFSTVATVNYQEDFWGLLFIQEDHDAIFVDKKGMADSKRDIILEPGTEIRISGTFDPKRYMINADSIEPTGKSRLIPPLNLNLSEMKLGAHWSKRVRLRGTVASVLSDVGHHQLFIRDGKQVALVRQLKTLDREQALSLLGAEIEFESTLAFLIDRFGRTEVPICYRDVNDELQVLKAAERIGKPEKIGSFKDLDHNQLTGHVEFTGQVSFISRRDFVVVEDENRDSLTVYAPAEALFSLGDSVRVVARAPTEWELKLFRNSVKAEAPLPALFASTLERMDRSLLPPAKTIETLEENSVGRVSVEGRLKSFGSNGFKRYLIVEVDGKRIRVDFLSGDKDFESLELSRVKNLGFDGLATVPSKEVAGDNIDRFVSLDSIRDIHVVSRVSNLDRRTVIATLAGAVCLLLFGTYFVVKLRRQVVNTNQNLQAIATQMRSSFDAINEALLVIDSEGQVVESNSRASTILRIDPADFAQTSSVKPSVLAQLSSKFSDTKQFDRFCNAVSTHPDASQSCELQTNELPRRTIRIHASPLTSSSRETHARVWTFDDVSERKRLEADLHQSQKLDAVGRLAGGVAHDFNNLLLTMTANLELVRQNPEQKVLDADEHLEAADQAVDKAKELVEQLLGFSRKTQLHRRVRNINEVVAQVHKLLERTLDPRYTLHVKLSDEVWNAKIDSSQVGNVILNMCLNARDAISGKSSLITISTRNVQATESPIDVESIVIRIQDSGTGIPAGVIDHIFDPFFTTKPPGKGTGLGLATSYGIIQQHDGTIVCTSSPGETIFEIYLPRTHEACSAEPENQPGSTPTVSTGNILLVDDDIHVLQPTAELLKLKGFDVRIAIEGTEAVQCVLSNPEHFNVVILDLSMPGMTGIETMRKIREISPGIPVIICSGYLHKLDRLIGSEFAPEAMMSKPFRVQELLQTIERVIKT